VKLYEIIGHEVFQGIPFRLLRDRNGLLAFCQLGDRNSGLVFSAIASDEGGGWPKLREEVHHLLDEITQACLEEWGEPHLICLGFGYEMPDEAPAQWVEATVPGLPATHSE
jgi:hypothetical protein